MFYNFRIMLKICAWRIWDKIVKFIWQYLGESARMRLWSFIDSKADIKSHLRDALNRSSGAIVQCGANDGISNDPLYDLIIETSRRSILIEPIDFLADKLRAVHKGRGNVSICEFAIHPELPELDFYHVSRSADQDMGHEWKPWFDQIGSFSKDHLLKHSSLLEPYIVNSKIQCKTLAQVVSLYELDEIAVLHIDAEGFDIEVLSSFDFKSLVPFIVMIEHKHVSLSSLFALAQQMRKMNFDIFAYHDDIVFRQKI